MAAAEDEQPAKEEGEESKESKAVEKPNQQDESRSIATIILLAVPLFCKFVIVLLIKFLTDLVVFPLLWLYRLARLTKRRILKFIADVADRFTGKPDTNGLDS